MSGIPGLLSIRRWLAAPLVGAWILIGGLATAASVVWWFGVRELEPLSSDFHVPWVLIVGGFFLAESVVIHLHFRSESGTFSLLEGPLVFGLLFAEPGLAVGAMLLGSVAGLVLVRRQPLLKLAFNLANLSLHFTLAFTLLPWFLSGEDPLAPIGWLAVIAATSITALLNFSMILMVVRIIERQFDAAKALRAAGFALLVAVANAVQALVAVLIVVSEPWAVLLLLCSAAILLGAYRGYVDEREQRERVEFLYASTRALREGGQAGSAVSEFLAETASMFRATTVTLYLFPAPDSESAPSLFTLGGEDFRADAITEAEEEAALSLAGLVPAPSLVAVRESAGELGEWLTSQGISEALVGALPSESRLVGLLVVGDRLGNVSTFTETDLRLFTTLVEHASVSLEKDQLGHALVQLRELGQELEHQAKYDGLTGLANRSTFAARLDEFYATGGEGASVLYIDLDDFKPVNDTYGHGAGDTLLTQVAVRIEAGVRGGDLAARLGGDEFAVLLAESDDAEIVAHRLIGSLSAPFPLGGNEVRIGASIGLAHRVGAPSSAELLRQADIALYAAKDDGKGAVVVYGEHLRQNLTRQQTLQSDLRRAVADEEFEVHYQPIVRIDDLAIVGAEALVRWRHPSGRLASPAEFINEAEQSGLITSVDRLVRTEVLEQLQIFRKIDASFFTTMNLSARHLLRPALVDEIRSDLLASGAPPEAVVFELTESVLARDIEAAVQRLNEIRDLGSRLALDDFGTGYSSLSYLRSLPIDLLKIARPFIQDMAAGDSTFVSAIIDLGQKLGFAMVAEGIEDGDAVTQLKGMGCDLGQGYFFARPMDRTDLVGLIARRRAPEAPATATSARKPATGS